MEFDELILHTSPRRLPPASTGACGCRTDPRWVVERARAVVGARG